jgi:hypothetical protein
MFYRVVTASRDTADLEATRTSLIVYNRSVELSQYNNLLLHLFSIPTVYFQVSFDVESAKNPSQAGYDGHEL